MSINRNIKNALAAFGGKQSFRNNAPSQHMSHKKDYYKNESLEFVDRFAKYSSDFVEAEMQMLGEDGTCEWKSVNLRIADMVRPSASATKNFDDFKTILIADKAIDYIRQGTKFVTMGSTWLAVNPMNISNAATTAVIRRCNAEWRYLDFFGNVKTEPIIIENALANANDSDTQEFVPVTKGYFNAIMQYNEATKELDTNSVIMLGRGAYRITGYSDFIQEFTGDYDSVRLLRFSLRYEEPNLETDDLERHIAKGKLFSWVIHVAGKSILKVGDKYKYSAFSERNGTILEVDGAVNYAYETIVVGNHARLNISETDTENPAKRTIQDINTDTTYAYGISIDEGETNMNIDVLEGEAPNSMSIENNDSDETYSYEMSVDDDQLDVDYSFVEDESEANKNMVIFQGYDVDYLWETSDSSVATVDDNGVVTAKSIGCCQVVARLAQNREIVGTMEVFVEEESFDERVEFITGVPNTLNMFDAITIKATKLIGNEACSDPSILEVSGADETAYSVEAKSDSLTIKCWDGSVTPLTIVARCGDLFATAQIQLIGI